MALPQSKQDALQARIAGLSFAAEGWLGQARAEGLARLMAMGMPGKRDEYWRYTDPAGFVSADVAKAEPSDGGETRVFETIDRLKIVFVDGVFDASQSGDLALAGVKIERLAQMGAQDIHWAREIYGVLEARGQSPVPRPLAAMNSAFATDGVLIRVMAKVAQPISIIYQTKSDRSDVMLHHCIKLEAGAELTLLEDGSAASRFTNVMEIEIADSARFHHIRTQGRDHERLAATHMFARIGSKAAFKSFTLTANGRMTRNEAVLELVGNDSVAHVAGAAMGDGEFLHDDTVFITHAAERCESRQVFKKVLKNGAVGVFQGKILVKPGAQKTDGYQISQALLLDGDSQFLGKPELEIYADDVKCSHGSTTGAIDETALYYLRSRGVPLRKAQSLLVLAFLAETIAEIEDAGIAEDVQQQLEAWLEGHDR